MLDPELNPPGFPKVNGVNITRYAPGITIPTKMPPRWLSAREICAMEFEPIPASKDGCYGQFGEQVAWIVEDQSGHLIIRTLIDWTGQTAPDARRLAKIPPPQVDQVSAHGAQCPVAGLLTVRPPPLGVLHLCGHQGARIAHRPNLPRLE